MAVRQSHLWSNILTMNQEKQQFFITRILGLHEIARRRAGKACVVRLSLEAWNQEADRICFLGHVLSSMDRMLNDDGDPLFPEDVLEKLADRAREGNPGCC